MAGRQYLCLRRIPSKLFVSDSFFVVCCVSPNLVGRMNIAEDHETQRLLDFDQYSLLTVRDQEPLIEERLKDFKDSFSRFRQRKADQLEEFKQELQQGLL